MLEVNDSGCGNGRVYFLPVIEEVLNLRVGRECFNYLRHKLERAGSRR